MQGRTLWMLPMILAQALAAAHAAGGGPAYDRPPDATVNLATQAGVSVMGAEWRYHDAAPVAVDFTAPGRDGKPGGAPSRTWDIEPRAGDAGFDDSDWPVIDPETLDRRRSTGKVCFAWYRIALVMPAQVGGVEIAGCTAVLDVRVDDYAEVWVDGRLPRALGQRGGSLVAGFNAPNRVVLSPSVTPGERVHVAVFAVNGPISDPPPNYIWVRSARVDFYRPVDAREAAEARPSIERIDPRLDEVLPPGALPRRVAAGFRWLEGPAWDGAAGCLYFSDIPANTVYRWTDADGASIAIQPSGYDGAVPFTGREPGSNGIAIDADGRLVLCQHGNRRVLRHEFTGRTTVLADHYGGARLNSPNDLVFAADGAVYFTDPPFGLPGGAADPQREIDVCGVYRLDPGGMLERIIDDLPAPNGIAIAADGRTLYVSNADPSRPVVMAYELRAGGRPGPGRVLFDATPWVGRRPGLPDGIKTDQAGRVYVAGPGGVYVLDAGGAHLGTILFGVPTANCTWGRDGATLFVTADTAVWEIDLTTRGTGF